MKKEIELEAPGSKRKLWIRVALVVTLIAIAISAFSYAIGNLISAETGYQTIECTASAANCSSEFVFTYNIGVSGISPTAELKAVTNLYNEKAAFYYRLFHPDEKFDDVVNVASLNTSPNVKMKIPEELYNCLEKAVADGTRSLFLGPVYAYYETLFSSSNDEDAATWDPAKNEDLAREYAETLAFASDSAHISVELKDGEATLRVSDEYLAFAKETGVTRFIDFGWIKNAHIADLIADDMTSEGFVHGALSSFDGFIRNFDKSKTEYTYNVYIDGKEGVTVAGALTYAEGAAICSLHPFKASDEEEPYYYEYADGTRVTRYISISDALPHGTSSSAVVWSRDVSCADMVYAALPYYLADNASEYAAAGTGSVTSDGDGFVYTPLEGFTFTENK